MKVFGKKTLVFDCCWELEGSPYGELVNIVAATNRTAKELFELSRQ